MTYVVIGIGGQVGREFSRRLSPDQLIGLDHRDLDVTDPESVARCLDRLAASVLIDLAAFHDASGCEENRSKAYRVNALGTANVAEAAADRALKCVYFSSEDVFGLDAGRRPPFLESDAVESANAYGSSKCAGEQLVRLTCPDHLIVRTSSLFGAVTSRGGWTFPEMVLRGAHAGERLRIVKNQYLSPTYIRDLVETTLALVGGDATGTVHISNVGGCTWYEFSETLLQLAGVEPVSEPVRCDELAAAAQRPGCSRIDSERLGLHGVMEPRPWGESLVASLGEVVSL